jgi:citrate/tricarballylate utilization protein
MQRLTDLAASGGGDCNGDLSLVSALSADEAEIARVMQICNACRYCEGFCAVFPAMTRRLEFNQADTH